MNRTLIKQMVLFVPILILATFIIVPAFVWFGCRIVVPANQMAVLVRKTGAEPPSGTVISSPDQKGIQLEVLSEGRYWYNPYNWDWAYFPITDVQAGELGVVIRKFGADLPNGEIIAKDGTKGIESDVLSPGKYRYNPFGYEIQIYPATTVELGSVGVMISLVGEDPLNGSPKDVNTYTVNKGEKGVTTKTLDAATYYLNPYIYSIIPVNLQSNRFELAGEDAIDFLTMDGFAVRVEGTLEYAVNRDNAAILTHKVGDQEDILKKIILPHARAFARIEGSKGNALNYIVGEMRQEFQNKLTQNLKENCAKWGIDIRSVLIRNIQPPEEISSIIRDRELAKQTAKMFEQQIVQAESKAELAKQKKLAEQNKEKVDAETKKLTATIQAQQDAAVRLTEAEQKLSVAKLEKAASEQQAAGLRAKGNGERTVIQAKNEATAAVLLQNANAFNGGENYAQYLIYQGLAPAMTSILTNDDPNSIGGILLDTLKPETKTKQTP